MKTKHIILSILATASIALSTTFADDDEGFKIDVHAFGSIAYVKTSSNNMFAADTSEGSGEFNEFGVNFGADLTPRLRVGLQLFSRNFGDLEDNAILLDWATIDYRVADFLSIQVGRVKTPNGLYNETRDIDLLRTQVFLPNSLYAEATRDYQSAILGIKAYGNISMGAGGDLDYSLVYGQLGVNKDGGVVNYIETFDVIANTNDVSNDYSYAANFIWNTPLDGFRVGIGRSYNKQVEFSGDATLTWTFLASLGGAYYPPGTPSTFYLPYWERNTISMEYSYNTWVFAAEYQQTEFDNGFLELGILQGVSNGGGWYISASNQWNDWLNAAVTYDEAYPFDEGSSNPGNYQKDLYFSARFDITSNWLVKAEYHFIEGWASTADAFNPQGQVKDWGMWTVKTTLSY